MDDVRLIKLLKDYKATMEADPHLKGGPQVALQHKQKYAAGLQRILRDAQRL